MISFQELCLQYGENNLTRTMLIDFIKQREKYLQLCVECKENEIKLLEEKRELKQQQYDDHIQKLNSDYSYLYKKWEEFSKCLDMEPEKFISMLDDLKEKIKSKADEIAQLREQLKTSELDAKRYKNDGIQDRVKLQELETEIKKHQELLAKITFDYGIDLSDYISEFWELFPTQKIDLFSHIESKKESDELVCKKLSKFQYPYIDILQRPSISYSNIYIKFDDSTVPLFIDSVKNNINKDDYGLLETEVYYTIVNKRNGDYLYTIDKLTKNVKTLTHLKLIKLNNTDCKDCACYKNCIKPIYTQIYFTIGAERILVDTVPFDVNYCHYNIGEDSTETKYVIARKDSTQKDLHNYAVDKNTLEVKVID